MTRAVHARRDPAWTADGYVSDRWMPVSPVTGRLDAFQWRDPLAGFDSGRKYFEAEREAPAAKLKLAQMPVPIEPATRSRARGPQQVKAPPVIPLVNAPDDPGPVDEPQPEVEIETSDDASPDGWKRLRQLFKQ